MFSDIKLAAYGCVRNAQYSSKRVTVCFVLLLTLAHVLFSLLPSVLSGVFHTAASPAYYITLFLTLLLLHLLSAGYTNYALCLSRGPDARWADTLACFRQPLRAVCVGCLILLPTGAFVLGAFWATAVSPLLTGLILALFGYLFYRYRLVWFVFFDDTTCSPLMVFRLAARISHGQRGRLLALDLQFAWFYVLAVVIPYILISLPELYPAVLTQLSQQVKTLLALLAAELVSGLFYFLKYDWVKCVYACYYNLYGAHHV